MYVPVWLGFVYVCSSLVRYPFVKSFEKLRFYYNQTRGKDAIGVLLYANEVEGHILRSSMRSSLVQNVVFLFKFGLPFKLYKSSNFTGGIFLKPMLMYDQGIVKIQNMRKQRHFASTISCLWIFKYLLMYTARQSCIVSSNGPVLALPGVPVHRKLALDP